ncbi:hypothetical protein STCU_08573 [Strigomonas culicis]|uniref:Uncharacterized protein n=1 Tax=Strigomonas culicis TaxID=28005 RepID=S9TSK4_9TRYP|nr:hypothetical protein STCU_08573 [Strigomonas culicis]|eukprot:EPY21377.1 hypothetical protein STCU_08573 [Strigomonas culicis]
MKFWVKTVVDSGLQEQLFVDANSTEELKEALEKLLSVSIEHISVTDFHAQVLDKLSSGADIITVRVRTAAASTPETVVQSTQVSPSAVQDSTSLENSRDITLTAPSSRGADRDTSMRARPLFTREDEEGIASLNSSQSQVNIGKLTSLTVSESPYPSRRTSGKSSFTDAPLVDRLWISREELCTLLDPIFNDKYKSDIIGCFVRVLEPEGYSIYQIIDVEPAVRHLVLDTVLSSEKRDIDTVSNAPPVKVEVKGWMKKMLNSFRTFPTPGFIEAKHSDLKSAISAAAAALEKTESMNDSQTPPQSSPSASGAALSHNTSPWHTPLPLKRLPLKEDTPPLFNMTRRVTTSHTPSAGLPSIRIVVKTNDLLKNAHVCIEDSHKSSHDVHVGLFGTRQANSTSKKERSSDFAGCHLLLNAIGSTGIERDRDITDKGYHMFGVPFPWNNGFLAVGQRHPLQSHFSRTRRRTGRWCRTFVCCMARRSTSWRSAG